MAAHWGKQAVCFDWPEAAEYIEASDKNKKKIAKAKSICRGCPVKSECLLEAVENNLPGFWGGTTEDERRMLNTLANSQGMGFRQFLESDPFGVRKEEPTQEIPRPAYSFTLRLEARIWSQSRSPKL